MRSPLNVERRSGYIGINTPAGSISIDKYGDILERWWSHTRGRCDEHNIRIRLWKFGVSITGRGKTYAQLTGCPDYNLDWILDEFDLSFNDLAVASLRYHQSYSVCYCRPERYAKYQDLIDRLSEHGPRFTDEEMAILHPPGWTFEDEFTPLPGGGSLMKPAPPEKHAVYEAHRQRENDYRRRIQQARHDFIDILPELWS